MNEFIFRILYIKNIMMNLFHNHYRKNNAYEEKRYNY